MSGMTEGDIPGASQGRIYLWQQESFVLDVYKRQHKQSVVTQREIVTDTDSYVTGLRASLRQAPDVILLGEMRDYETISIAMTAAETGHLDVYKRQFIPFVRSPELSATRMVQVLMVLPLATPTRKKPSMRTSIHPENPMIRYPAP